MTSTRQLQGPRSPSAQFVLPQPPRSRGPVLFGAEPNGGGAVLLQHAAAGLPVAGRRMLTLLECQDLFLAEVRARLRELEADPLAATDVQSRVQGIGAVLDWCDTVQADLLIESRRAAAGEQLVDLRSLCDDAVHQLRNSHPEVAVEVHGAPAAVWAEVLQIGEVVQSALVIAADRIGGHGGLTVEIDGTAGSPRLWIRGRGEPVALTNVHALERFRAAATAMGGDTRNARR